MRKRPSFWLKCSCLLIVLVTLPAYAAELSGMVMHVADGDTITVRLDNGIDETVRLIGLDCPEMKSRGKGKAAAWAARDFLVDNYQGKKVILKTDPAGAKNGHRGSFKRLLAYAYLADDDKSLQERLLAAGHCKVLAKYPYDGKMREKLKAAWKNGRSDK